MSLIEWRQEFSTGIPGIDYEHEELIASINAFHESSGGQSEKDIMVNALNDIYGAIYAHFALEERLMEKHHYDQYQEHRADHARLLDEIRDITTVLEETSKYDEQQLKERLNDWFSVHFRTHDARLHKLEELIASQKKHDGGLLASLKESVVKLLSGK